MKGKPHSGIFAVIHPKKNSYKNIQIIPINLQERTIFILVIISVAILEVS